MLAARDSLERFNQPVNFVLRVVESKAYPHHAWYGIAPAVEQIIADALLPAFINAELSPSLSIVKDERARQTISEQIAEASQLIQKQEQIIDKCQRSIERSTLPAIDKEEFKTALKSIAEKLKAADVFQKDAIVSNLFLKLYFDQQKMTRYLLNEPFASLIALNEFQSGGGGWNRTIYQVVMSRLL